MRRTAAAVAAFFVPTSDGEAAVLFGLALVAAAFLAAGLVPLAIGVPGGLYVAIGLGFNLRGR